MMMQLNALGDFMSSPSAAAPVPASIGLTAAGAALDAWRRRLLAANRNVADLADHPGFLALRNRLRGAIQPPLQGASAEAAQRLVASVDELSRSVDLLGGALSKADAMLNQAMRRLLNPDAVAADVGAILEGASIEVVLAEVPVLQRGLLGGSKAVVQISPEQLLATMGEAFKATAQQLAALNDGEMRTTKLVAEAEAALSGFAGQAEAADLHEKLAAARILASTDPLAAVAAAESVVAGLAAAQQAVEARKQAMAEAQRALQQARADLRQLDEELTSITNAAIHCAARVFPAPEAPDVTQARELPGWLGRLATTLDAGRVGAFQVGLTRWRSMLAAQQMALAASQAAIAAALARREELRGRFGALEAKQASLASKGAVLPPDIEAQAIKLRGYLFKARTPLAPAAAEMTQYEAMLARAASGRSS